MSMYANSFSPHAKIDKYCTPGFFHAGLSKTDYDILFSWRNIHNIIDPFDRNALRKSIINGIDCGDIAYAMTAMIASNLAEDFGLQEIKICRLSELTEQQRKHFLPYLSETKNNAELVESAAKQLKVPIYMSESNDLVGVRYEELMKLNEFRDEFVIVAKRNNHTDLATDLVSNGYLFTFFNEAKEEVVFPGASLVIELGKRAGITLFPQIGFAQNEELFHMLLHNGRPFFADHADFSHGVGDGKLLIFEGKEYPRTYITYHDFYHLIGYLKAPVALLPFFQYGALAIYNEMRTPSLNPKEVMPNLTLAPIDGPIDPFSQANFDIISRLTRVNFADFDFEGKETLKISGKIDNKWSKDRYELALARIMFDKEDRIRAVHQDSGGYFDNKIVVINGSSQMPLRDLVAQLQSNGFLNNALQYACYDAERLNLKIF